MPADDRAASSTTTASAFRRPSLSAHLAPEGPKRILALDGGGVRGAMTVAVLERIEKILRAAHGDDPDFRLCDYFDLIGGTSTGSIIAGGLAIRRFTAADIKDFYFEKGPLIFRAKFFRNGLSLAKFDAAALLTQLDEVFGDVPLGSPDISTGLAIVTKRADTDSTWVLHNHPGGRYFENPEDGSYIGNRHYPVRNLIRASTAAPHYFRPERIEIVEGREHGLFVDGAISPHNNPSFQMLMLAGLEGYNYGWKMSPEDLMMISVGTGSSAMTRPQERYGLTPQIVRTVTALTSVITSAEDFIEILMQWVSESRDPQKLDSEIGDLARDFLGGRPLLRYERYQSVLTREAIRERFGLDLTEKQVAVLRRMDDPACIPLAYELGQAMAETLVKPEHFPARFNLAGTASEERTP